ncbi:MAG: hemerythrin domain-containing protein [Candidatus Accumulibacter sp.]|jgi:hemerythrin-like domain-containing protein|uniref:hemerythrin domain-containing protein n=1 Tax=unclassified Candidatus Accumulibacter TaxID=2619054 RepID=UPI0012C0BBE9|nr:MULTISPECIES: hemerythrin domain-containing protein [unclassified Candidatus Accumulibacter]MQM35591.1 hemerythrin [Candidatus Accumulibacter phosphatis]MBL8367325.1 hemerythrin domain-containing protein [Accumulibacter sp.]MBN8514565.1 hemerythrin domain-containing protein [Accumulibacter sp.]MBO3702126.1 hemerythrin domain-containing protein [Accumulibacter sp.]HRI90454.1 hemerythrin domain-containing protein [Accumulibacter sp.]
MREISELMTRDHRSCDDLLATVDNAVANDKWALAEGEFARFQKAMLNHFEAEEAILFPLFEKRTGMHQGPTQVMRSEHVQMRQLLAAAEAALAERAVDDYSGNAETLLIMIQQHNVKEENILYPMCDQQLADQLEALLPKLQKQLSANAKTPA